MPAYYPIPEHCRYSGNNFGIDDAIGVIGSIFGGSAERKAQIAQRESDARVNGYPDFKTWDAAGQPWYKEGYIKHHQLLGYPIIQSEVDALPSMYATQGTGYPTPPGNTSGAGSGGGPSDDRQTQWFWIIGVLLIIGVVMYVANNKNK